MGLCSWVGGQGIWLGSLNSMSCAHPHRAGHLGILGLLDCGWIKSKSQPGMGIYVHI